MFTLGPRGKSFFQDVQVILIVYYTLFIIPSFYMHFDITKHFLQKFMSLLNKIM